jgi:hypothetical protein
MRLFIIIFCILVSPTDLQYVFGQGFLNLDFESANLAPVPAGEVGGYVSITDAIPAWTAFVDGNPISQVIQNNGTAGGSPSLSIWGSDAPPDSGVLVFQGNYNVILSAGFGGHATSISQAGLVPASANLLLFKASAYSAGSGSFSVSMGDQNLDYYALSTEVNFTIYAADVSAFAGLVKTLTFTDNSAASAWNYEQLDDIQFVSEAVPEPSVPNLLGMCIILVLLKAMRPNTALEATPHSRRRFASGCSGCLTRWVRGASAFGR